MPWLSTSGHHDRLISLFHAPENAFGACVLLTAVVDYFPWVTVGDCFGIAFGAGGLLLGPALHFTTQVVVAVVDMGTNILLFTVYTRCRKRCLRRERKAAMAADVPLDDMNKNTSNDQDGNWKRVSKIATHPDDEMEAPHSFCRDVAGLCFMAIGVTLVAVANPPEFKLPFIDVLNRFYQLEFLCYLGGLICILLVLLIIFSSTNKTVREQ